MGKFIIIGCFLGFLAVLIGAFGAHALKGLLSTHELEIFSTGSEYHFYHVLALIGYALYGEKRKIPSWPAWAFIFGIIAFSGSLYSLAVFHMPKLGVITPFGGFAFIVGWIGFGLAGFKEINKSQEQ